MVKKIWILVSIFVLFNFFPMQPQNAGAWGLLEDVTAPGAMDDIMEDLGIDKNELEYAVKTFNVSRLKKQPPLVSLVFDPANPEPGKKVTAIANTTYFNNSSSDLYFTWFLKPSGCPDDEVENPSASIQDKCDFDNDGEIDIEDYKTRAMRALASNDFDWDRDGDGEPDSDVYNTSRNDDDGYRATWGGDDQRGKPHYCYIHDTSSGNEYEIDCDKHLFPDVSVGTVGDGSFNSDEEKFWHTDPNDPDTADTGSGDEGNVTGLGRVSFSWIYEQGDEVGVVVEGVSNEPTQEDDSSYRTMWALPKNKCALGDTDGSYPKEETHRGDRVAIVDPGTGETTGYTVAVQRITEEIVNQIAFWAEIRTTTESWTETLDLNLNLLSTSAVTTTTATRFVNISNDVAEHMRIGRASDINECLYKNFVDPYEGGGEASKIDVSLSYLPQAPMNDPTPNSNEGDELVLHSSVTNAHNSNYLNYAWQVYQSDEANPQSWGAPLLKEDLKDSTQTTGLGLSTFKFKLNFPNPRKYLRVKLTVTENAGNQITREGHSSVVIPISSTSERIRTYDTVVSETSGNLTLNIASNERCSGGKDKAVCPVIKDEIVGVQVNRGDLTDFLWTINGEPVRYAECFFEGCQSNSLGNTMFFPVLEGVGFEYNVAMTATNQTSGQKVHISRAFQVSEPEVKIFSADESACRPVLLGYYVDLDGKSWPDYSKTDFVGLEGPITLSAHTNSPKIAYVWYENGNLINEETARFYGYSFDNGNLVLRGKTVGESYRISLGGFYSPDVLTKKALNRFWQVPLSSFYEKNTSATIKIAVKNSLGDLASKNQKGKILASVYSATPAYLAFLFRLVITAFLMIFLSSFILSFFPDIKTPQE